MKIPWTQDFILVNPSESQSALVSLVYLVSEFQIQGSTLVKASISSNQILVAPKSASTIASIVSLEYLGILVGQLSQAWRGTIVYLVDLVFQYHSIVENIVYTSLSRNTSQRLVRLYTPSFQQSQQLQLFYLSQYPSTLFSQLVQYKQYIQYSSGTLVR